MPKADWSDAAVRRFYNAITAFFMLLVLVVFILLPFAAVGFITLVQRVVECQTMR